MRSGETLQFTFDDARAAQRGAALLRLVVTKLTPKERAVLREAGGLAPGEKAPPSGPALQRLLRRLGEDAVDAIEAREQVVDVELMLHDDADVHDDGITSKVRQALERFMHDVGGFTTSGLEARARTRAREADLAEARGNGPELLARLEAAKDQLLRFEKVILESLRTSAAAGSILDGQWVEALKILRRLEGPKT